MVFDSHMLPRLTCSSFFFPFPCPLTPELCSYIPLHYPSGIMVNVSLIAGHKGEALAMEKAAGTETKSTWFVGIFITRSLWLITHWHSFANSQIISVLVGVERKCYYFHKDLLVSKSLFFKKCLQSGFQGGCVNQITLHNEDPVQMDLLVE